MAIGPSVGQSSGGGQRDPSLDRRSEGITREPLSCGPECPERRLRPSTREQEMFRLVWTCASLKDGGMLLRERAVENVFRDFSQACKPPVFAGAAHTHVIHDARQAVCPRPGSISRMEDTSPSNALAAVGTSRKTPWLFAGLVLLVAMIAAPSFVGRLQYARTRAELSAIRDAAGRAELAPVGKLFTTLAKLTGPAVVTVEASFDLADLADEIRSLRGTAPGSVSTQTIGSGVVIDADGVIVTNYHVVAQAERIVVQLADGRRFEGELAGADAATDLAVLRIEASRLPVAPWGDSDTIEPGEMVWAVGNPFGLGRTITYGIISGVGRRGVAADPFQEFLQTDAAINPGSSGGPLVDVHGHIVGITTAIVGRAYRGIGFAIPSNDARRVCEEILRTGHVERGYLGVALADAPGGRHGAVVTAVEQRSPAALADIRPGDLVTSFDGQPVAEAALLVLLVTRSRIGHMVELGIVRQSEGASEPATGEASERSLTVTVRVGRRPADE